MGYEIKPTKIYSGLEILRPGTTGGAADAEALKILYSPTEFETNITTESSNGIHLDAKMRGNKRSFFGGGASTYSTLNDHVGKIITHAGNSANQDQIWNEITPGNSDIGKSWTFVNRSTSSGCEIKLSFANQYVRFMDGASTEAKKWTWSIGRGGIAELVCVGAVVGGGSTGSPNFILYGSGIGQA